MANSAFSRQVTVPEASIEEGKLAAGATLKLGTEQASTSGTAIDFTGIPSGTKMIVISLVGVSTNGASGLTVQIGDAGGIEATGYVAAGGRITGANTCGLQASTTAFGELINGSGANAANGQIVLVVEDTTDFTWAAHGAGAIEGTAWYLGGSKSLSATLDRVRVTSASGDTFDAGSINIAYK